MQLKKLTLKNFKGIKNFTLDVDGNDATVYGANATGKTTIMDAFLFLLFDKNSEDSAKFGIKTVDTQGNTKSGIDHEVEGVFDVLGKELTLKKVYTEVWTKHRGSATAQFTRNTTNHFINGVPKTKKLFTEKIKCISDERTFRLLTNPRYFNEVLKWEDCRDLLFKACEDITNISDSDVIAKNNNLSAIIEMLDGITLEEKKEVIKTQRTEINKELDKIPVRIDEQTQAKTNEDPRPAADLRTEKAEVTEQLSVLRNKLSMIESGGAIGLKKKELLDVEIQIQEIENELDNQAHNARLKLKSIARYCKEALDAASKKPAGIEADIDLVDGQITRVTSELGDLREAWNKINERQFAPPEIAGPCPTCGAIPEHQVNFSEENAMAAFNKQKSDDLLKNNETGKAMAANLKEQKAKKTKLEKELTEAQKALETAQVDHDKAQADLKKPAKTPTPTKAHRALIDKKFKIEGEISELAIGSHDESDGIHEEIKILEANLEAANNALAAIDAGTKAAKRIDELMARERELAAEFEKCEADLNLLENFTRAKCNMLTEKIDSKFKITRWRLFEDQINTGMRDCCVATVGGVPYPDLNNAARINSGIDIVNMFSDFYGVTMPMFIDNAESVTDLIDTEAQRICLIVAKLFECKKCGWIGVEEATKPFGREYVEDKICPKCGGNILKEYKKLRVEVEEQQTSQKAA